MPRFAILIHDHPFLHWDFLLEQEETCRTWRLLDAPDSPLIELSAEELPPHRLLYLDYEGLVSQQRGTVTRWDGGTFEWQRNESDQCEILLKGQKWQGVARLIRLDEQRWKCLRPCV